MQEVNDLLYLTESYSYDNLYNELVADYELSLIHICVDMLQPVVTQSCPKCPALAK